MCHYWDEKVSINFGIIASYSVLGLRLKLCDALADVWLLALVCHTCTNQLKNFYVYTYSIMYKFCPLTNYHLHHMLHSPPPPQAFVKWELQCHQGAMNHFLKWSGEKGLMVTSRSSSTNKTRQLKLCLFI